MRVDCYRNLRNGTISVRALDGTDRGRVIDHVQTIELVNAKFVVQPAGRQKVIDTRRKNVHAFVRGDALVLEGKNAIFPPDTWKEVTYNPYKYSTFVYKESEQPVYESPIAIIRANGKIYVGGF